MKISSKACDGSSKSERYLGILGQDILNIIATGLYNHSKYIVLLQETIECHIEFNVSLDFSSKSGEEIVLDPE